MQDRSTRAAAATVVVVLEPLRHQEAGSGAEERSSLRGKQLPEREREREGSRAQLQACVHVSRKREKCRQHGSRLRDQKQDPRQEIGRDREKSISM